MSLLIDDIVSSSVTIDACGCSVHSVWIRPLIDSLPVYCSCDDEFECSWVLGEDAVKVIFSPYQEEPGFFFGTDDTEQYCRLST